MFKRMVGGGVIQVRKIYKDSYEIENRAKLIITCNELPASYDSTYGFTRRITVIPFDRKFSVDDADYDPDIDEKIMTELPGVFNRFLEGYARLQGNKRFTECLAITSKLEEYYLETDSVVNWGKENMAFYYGENMDSKFITIGDMYLSYKTRVEMGGERPVKIAVFGKRLKKWIPDYDERYLKKRIDGKVYRGLRGVDVFDGAGLELPDTVKFSDEMPTGAGH